MSDNIQFFSDLHSLLHKPFTNEQAVLSAMRLLGKHYKKFSKLLYRIERLYPEEASPHAGCAQALLYYTAGGFEVINQALRNLENITQDHIDLARLIIQAARSRPVYQREVYRGECHWPGWKEVYSPGNIIQTWAFTSTSMDPSSAHNGKIAIQIWSRTGRIITPYSFIQAEKEVLFMPATRFHVVGVDLGIQPAMISLQEE
jgi:hypothetical protein